MPPILVAKYRQWCTTLVLLPLSIVPAGALATRGMLVEAIGLMVAAFTLNMWLLVRFVRSRAMINSAAKAAQHRLCGVCGYALSGANEHAVVCPECGQAYDSQALQSFWQRFTRPRHATQRDGSPPPWMRRWSVNAMTAWFAALLLAMTIWMTLLRGSGRFEWGFALVSVTFVSMGLIQSILHRAMARRFVVNDGLICRQCGKALAQHEDAGTCANGHGTCSITQLREIQDRWCPPHWDVEQLSQQREQALDVRMRETR